MIIIPWYGEIYYTGKILFTLLLTSAFIVYILKINYKLLLPRLDKITIILILYALLISLSTILSIDFRLSLLGHPRNREGLIVLLLYIVIFYLFYMFFEFSVKIFEYVLVCSSIVSIYGILCSSGVLPAAYDIFSNSWEYGAALSTIGNRNFVGTYCTIFLPLAIGFWLYISNYRGFIYISILFSFLIISQTRSAWLAFFIYTALFIILTSKKIIDLRKWLVLFLMLFSLFIIQNSLSNGSLIHRIHLLLADFLNISSDTAGSNRMYYWKRAFPLTFDKPLLGYGPDTFGNIFIKNFGFIEIYFPKFHNEYMQIALTTGYISLLLYLSLICMTLKKLLINIRSRPINIVLLCCICGYLFQALFNVSIITNACIFWAILGITLHKE